MINESIIFWSAIAIVLLIAFGHTAYEKVSALNKKHHLIEIDNESVYVCGDDNDDDDD